MPRNKTSNIQNQSQPSNNESTWHPFLLSALYFSAIPQVLTKIIKPGDIPAILDISPDKLILTWTVILGIVFLIVVPLFIAWISTPENLTSLKKRTIKGFCLGKYIYWIVRACGCLFFIFYLGIEIAGINQL